MTEQLTLWLHCVFWLLHWLAIPLITRSDLTIPLNTAMLKLGLIVTLKWTLKEFKWKEESLTLSQELEMIKLSKEGTPKADTGQKLGLLHQLAKLWMQRKSSWKKVLLQWTNRW